MRCAICTHVSCTSLVDRTTAWCCWRAEIIDNSQHSRSCSVGVAVILSSLALPLLLLGLLCGLLLLLLALALGLLFGSLLLIVLALLGLLGCGLRLLASGCNSGGGKNLGGRSGLGKRCGLDVGPVEVLVLGVPLSGGLLVGAAKFLVVLAVRAGLSRTLQLTSSVPASFIFFFSVATGPMPHRLGYKSRSMITRLILATTPWSQDVISTADICA